MSVERPHRSYKKIWEKDHPWLTMKMDGHKEVAHCTWCNVDLGLYTTRFKGHGQTMKHRKNDPNGTFKKMMEDVDDVIGNSKNIISDEEANPEISELPQVFNIPVSTEVLLTQELRTDTGEAVVSGDDLKGTPISVDFSLPVSTEILDMLAMGQPDSEVKDDVVTVQPPVRLVPMCTLKANAQHPLWFQEEMMQILITGAAFDLIWKCKGGNFRAHKFVLAAHSEQLKKILPDNDVLATLYTPEMSSETVRAILTLFYTGEASLNGSILKEINDDFLTMGFYGRDLTATPVSQEKTNEDSFSMSPEPVVEPLEHLDDFLDDDYSDIFDTTPDPVFVDCKQEKNAIKIEVEEEEGNLFETVQPPRKKAKLDKTSDIKSSKNKYIDDRDMDVLMDKTIISEDNEVVRLKDDEKKKNKIQTYRETQFTYSIKSKKKSRGALSHMLPFDLFDDKSIAEKVVFITVCPVCLKVFDDMSKMKDHRVAFHNIDYSEWNSSKNNSMILDKRKLQKFHCTKCDHKFELKHLVWFVKHYKYCGVDDEKAQQLLQVNDVEDEYVDEKENQKEETKETDMLQVRDNPRHTNMCSVLLNKEKSSEIWGCRKCYEAFEGEEDLTNHINEAHEGKLEHGTLYDEQTKTYSCQKCKVFKTNKNVVYFIYHLKKCDVESKSGVPIDDEEDVDEDTSEDFVDPWGIIYKPLKIRNERSKWICESLFGELHEILYPCHVCYTVFKQDEELREHFRSIHPGLQNFAEFGQYFNKIDKGYDCPVCKRNVCKKDKNTIYFAYHMQKCSGNLHSVTRECPNCQEKFSSLRTYQLHLQSKCGALSFVCHICGLALKTKQNLKNHVTYFHTEERKHKCNVCDTLFKRDFDLKQHMRRHMGSLDFSCEKCGKAFPVKKALTRHMRAHFSEDEKKFACHVCGYRFASKGFLINHLTTHSDFRAFACEVCNAKVKTRDSLKQHRKKVHRLVTPIPDSCILKPDDPEMLRPLMSVVKSKRGGRGAVGKKEIPMLVDIIQTQSVSMQIKEEQLPILEEELVLPFNG